MTWLKRKLYFLLEVVLDKILGSLSQSTFILLILHLVGRRGDRLTHEDRLRFLFDLDDAFSQLQNLSAIQYEGGIHPKHRLMRYHDFFTNRINKGEQVLDIGCSIGAVAYDIAEKTGAFVLGFDIDEDNIIQAEKLHPHPHVEYQVGDAMKDLPSTPFDVVVLSNILEHLDQRNEFLKQILNEVTPKRVLIRVPMYERDWRVPLRQELGAEWRLDSTHTIEYTLDSFADEMHNAGLQIRDIEIRWGEIWAEVIPNVL